MMVQPIPKPTHKHKAQKRNPVPTAEDYCMYCGTSYAQTHEIFGGPNRQLSIKYKLQVRLCNTCHRNITDNVWLDRVNKLKRMGQAKFEARYSREEFIRIFKKNYL
jgi:hypothetical protein